MRAGVLANSRKGVFNREVEGNPPSAFLYRNCMSGAGLEPAIFPLARGAWSSVLHYPDCMSRTSSLLLSAFPIHTSEFDII